MLPFKLFPRKRRHCDETTQFSLGLYPRVQPLQLLFLTAGGLVACHQVNVISGQMTQHLNKLLTATSGNQTKNQNKYILLPCSKYVCSGKGADAQKANNDLGMFEEKIPKQTRHPIINITQVTSFKAPSRLSYQIWVLATPHQFLDGALESCHIIRSGKTRHSAVRMGPVQSVDVKLPFFQGTPRTNITNRL